MALSDWTTCPDCGAVEGITVDVHVIYYEDDPFLLFECDNCGYSSLEDDIRWWVICPECMVDEDTPTDLIEGGVDDTGQMWLECDNCGNYEEEYPSTHWDGQNLD